MINPQGYNYKNEPLNSNPFWGADDVADFNITATASVDETAGTPAVRVETSQGAASFSMDFAFSGLKGETGPQGPQGEAGEKGADGTTPAVTSTGASSSGALAGTITGADGTAISVYNGAQGETGPQGPQGEAGSAANAVTNVSLTNENGVYTFSQTINGSTMEIGGIDVPESPDVSNLLAEVTDLIVENESSGYDLHTITETENNGTRNNVGSFYIARNQITGISSDGAGNLTINKVNQSGSESSQTISVGGGSTSSSSLKWVDLGNYTSLESLSEAIFLQANYENTLAYCLNMPNGITLAGTTINTTYMASITAAGVTFSGLSYKGLSTVNNHDYYIIVGDFFDSYSTFVIDMPDCNGVFVNTSGDVDYNYFFTGAQLTFSGGANIIGLKFNPYISVNFEQLTCIVLEDFQITLSTTSPHTLEHSIHLLALKSE